MLMIVMAMFLAQAAPPPALLAGTWAFDASASDDPGPMMAKLGVPSFLASAADTSTQVISIDGSRLTVTVDGVLGHHVEEIDLDASPILTGTLLTYTYTVRPVVSGDAVISTGTIRIGEQSQVFVSKRSVSATTMTVETTIGSGKEATTFRRVFRRKT